MANIILNVKGMTCDGCVRSVKKVLEPLPGVTKVNVSLEKGEVVIDFDEKKVRPSEFKSAIEDAGYDVLS